MESKPTRTEETPYTRTTYQEEKQNSPEALPRGGSRACLLSRRSPRRPRAGSSAIRRTAILKESIRRRDPEFACNVCYGLVKKATGETWKGLRSIPPGQNQWKPSGESKARTARTARTVRFR